MRVHLAYGRSGLALDIPDEGTTILEPEFVPGLPDEKSALREALRSPVGTKPLQEIVRPGDRVAVVFSDITRPMPNDRVLPVLLSELSHVPPAQVILINALGMHRPNTPDELESMLGPDLLRRYRIVQHDARNDAEQGRLGTSQFGHRISINRRFLQADRKILTGFIEPHFFAGFSGGGKAVLPGISGEATILANHGGTMVGHPKATWGITSGNPIFEEILEAALLAEPDFILNVTLNRRREITGVFAGELRAAHERGVRFARERAMRPVRKPFDVVVATNSGYPLDLNLYQTVKGMSAAAQIVKEGGSILVASECSDGIPSHGHYRELLHSRSSPADLLAMVKEPGFRVPDGWEVQLQAEIQMKAEVFLYSALPDAEVRAAHLTPCHDMGAALLALLKRHGPRARLAVLPDGPQTIPYLTE
jgi:nickel-dependent lactate racemase